MATALSASFRSVRLQEAPATPSPGWLGLDHLEFPLAQPLAPAPPGSRPLVVDAVSGRPAIVEGEDGVSFLFDPEAALEDLRHERWLVPRRPLHTRLPMPYQLVPGPVRLAVFRWMTGAPASAGFPRWPADPTADVLAGLVRRARHQPDAPPWPGGHGWAVVLSHDVDTPAGLRAAREVGRWECDQGWRAAWYVVGELLERDPGVADALRELGHEVGLHGDRHDNRIAYARGDELARRAATCAATARRFGLRGFRAPSLLESPALREVLQPHFDYASQVPDTEEGSLIGPRRGCATTFPFLRHGWLEVPITLPFDDKLLLRGLSPSDMTALWRRKMDWIRERGGMAHLAVHNEPHLLARARPAWEKLLAEIGADPTAWRATPGEVADWWRGTRADG